MKLDYLPIFYNIKNRPVLVVGGGTIATRKIALLLESSAMVHVISETFSNEISQWILDGIVTGEMTRFNQDDLSNYALIIAATNDTQCNTHVATLAKDRQTPVNVVDDADLSTFIMPAIIDRSPVLIAVSTSGASPVLSRLLRTKLESFLPARLSELAKFAASIRDKVKTSIPESNRRRFWETVLQGPIGEAILAGRPQKNTDEVNRLIEGHEKPQVGEVYLVGGGPGDPDLLTFRAVRLMQQADVVLYDRLVSEDVLNLVRRDAERIYVGKKRSNHAMSQTDINNTLIKIAKQGKRVLRLKGGDPFIFGRGGEEIDTLMERGIPFQVVPGITAAAGCAAYAGIPLTHRDYAQSVMFVTGYLKDGKPNLPWNAMTQENQTLVIYMGIHSATVICENLVAHGMADDTPCAVIQRGTTKDQAVYTTTIKQLPDTIEANDIKPPALLIVGNVVKLQSRLNWFNPT